MGDRAGAVEALRASPSYVELERRLSPCSIYEADTEKGCSLLHEAVACGNFEGVMYLMERGADVNARDKWGQTPLLYAVVNGYGTIAAALLGAGADANITGAQAHAKGQQGDRRGLAEYPPLFYAVRRGDVETAALLLAHGAMSSVDVVDSDRGVRVGLLGAAVHTRCARMCALLRANGAQAAVGSENALLLAAKTRDVDVFAAVFGDGLDRAFCDDATLVLLGQEAARERLPCLSLIAAAWAARGVADQRVSRGAVSVDPKVMAAARAKKDATMPVPVLEVPSGWRPVPEQLEEWGDVACGSTAGRFDSSAA